MTSAASYVTRALLVLGAIMNSLIALKYIAGSKASTVESLGPIGKLFKPEYIDRGLGAMAAFAGVAYINVCVVNVVAAFAFDDTAAATVLLIFAIVFMLIMSAMRSFYMDPQAVPRGRHQEGERPPDHHRRRVSDLGDRHALAAAAAAHPHGGRVSTSASPRSGNHIFGGRTTQSESRARAPHGAGRHC